MHLLKIINVIFNFQIIHAATSLVKYLWICSADLLNKIPLFFVM
jgi:hypothetical protein